MGSNPAYRAILWRGFEIALAFLPTAQGYCIAERRTVDMFEDYMELTAMNPEDYEDPEGESDD